MKHLYELRDMLMDELKSLTSKGELTAGSLDTVDKLTHSIKSIDTICAMEEAGDYSYDGMSYADRRTRDNRGRYSSDSGSMNNGSYRNYSRRYSRGYSGNDKQEVIEELRDLMNQASDSKTRQAIKQAIMDMED